MSDQQDPQFNHIKGAIEALLFTNERPTTIDQLKGALQTVSAGEIKKAIADLMDDYQDRQSGISIIEIAGGYQMLSNSTYASYIRNFYKTKHKEKLSKPALESLAIIAYKQPVTRADVEQIRGVNSDGVVAHLLEKELIKVVGRREVAGRPFEYGTTKQFMEYFGLKSLDDLPNLQEFPSLIPGAELHSSAVDQLTGEPLSSMELSKMSAIRESEENILNQTLDEDEDLPQGDYLPEQDLSEESFTSEDPDDSLLIDEDQSDVHLTVQKAEEFLEEVDKE